MGRTIQAESHTGELPALWIWEFSSNTYEFWDQPEPISVPLIRRDGKRTKQLKTADFLVLQDNYVGWVECKPRAWLEEQLREGNPNFHLDENGLWHYLPGEHAAKAFGMGFVVRLAEDNSPILVDNLSFLDDYLVDDAPEVPREAKMRLLDLVAEQGWMLLEDLLIRPDVVADHLYLLIARRELHVQLEDARLAEPARTYVYTDRESVGVHKALLQTRTTAGAPDLSFVDLTPGANILWDGRLFKILNNGATGFFLETEEHCTINVPRESLIHLIGEGKILADPAVPSAREARSAERMRRASESERRRAVARHQALFPSDEAGPSSVPQRTLTWWRQLFRKGEEIYGNGFVGLLPDIHMRGNRTPKLPAATREIMVEVIRAQYMTPEAKAPKVVWGIVRNRCEAAGTIAPSESAIKREIRRLFTQEEIVKARHGAKAAYQVEPIYSWLDLDTPRHGQRPFEIGHLDHTEADLQLVDSRYGRQTRRCWVSALIDANTRKVLSTYVTFDPPSYRSCMMILRECVRRHGRVPDTIVVDGGGDFQSVYFDQLLAFLNVKKKNRPKSKARHGTLVERLFKRINEDFLHQLRGNNKALQKPRSMSRTHDPRERAVWTLERFIERFNEYLDGVYAKQVNETLGVSPDEAFEVGMRNFGERLHRRIAYDAAFKMCCLPSTPTGVARVRPGAYVRIHNIPYQAPELMAAGFVGTDVRVRYDPFNAGVAYAYVQSGWVEMRSPHYAVFSRYSEREIQAATEEIRERFGERYRNRAVNAEMLAKFLSEVDQQEQLMGMDQESEQAPAAPKRPACEPLMPVAAISTGGKAVDAFEDLEIAEYGDIE